MSLLYADTSALVRAYFEDEPDHARLREKLLEGEEPVVTSELARVELASAIRAAAETGRLRSPGGVLS
ncbi:MAG: PIN domain-containing protein, partial [bacterium]